MTAQRWGCWLRSQARHQMSSCIHCFEFGPCLEETAEWSGTLHTSMKGSDAQGQRDQDHWESRTRVGSIEVDIQTEKYREYRDYLY